MCDYLVQTVVTDDPAGTDLWSQLCAEMAEKKEIGVCMDVQKSLFVAAFAALMSIRYGHSHHLFIYCNSMTNCERVVYYIGAL